jgi:hypothetical protein
MVLTASFTRIFRLFTHSIGDVTLDGLTKRAEFPTFYRVGMDSTARPILDILWLPTVRRHRKSCTWNHAKAWLCPSTSCLFLFYFLTAKYDILIIS